MERNRFEKKFENKFEKKHNIYTKFQDIFRTKSKHSIFQNILQERKNFRAFPRLLEFPGLVDTLIVGTPLLKAGGGGQGG